MSARINREEREAAPTWFMAQYGFERVTINTVKVSHYDEEAKIVALIQHDGRVRRTRKSGWNHEYFARYVDAYAAAERELLRRLEKAHERVAIALGDLQELRIDADDRLGTGAAEEEEEA